MRPTWATVVGVLGIIFSLAGMMGAGQSMLLPKFMELQQEMMGEMSREFNKMQGDEARESGSTPKPLSPEEKQAQKMAASFFTVFQSMQKFMEVPPWYQTWSVVAGVLKLLACGFLLFASITLLQMKPSSLRQFYWAAGLNIALAALSLVVSLGAMNFLAMAMGMGGFFGIILNSVLILVVATGNKAAFYPHAPPPLPREC